MKDQTTLKDVINKAYSDMLILDKSLDNSLDCNTYWKIYNREVKTIAETIVYFVDNNLINGEDHYKRLFRIKSWCALKVAINDMYDYYSPEDFIEELHNKINN